jgi:hypothetical protein
MCAQWLPLDERQNYSHAGARCPRDALRNHLNLAVLAASSCAIAYLYSYLAHFDWSLIWLVEYSDVFKVGLVVIGFFSSLSFSIWWMMSILGKLSDAPDDVIDKKTRRILAKGIFVCIIVANISAAYFFGLWRLFISVMFAELFGVWAFYRLAITVWTFPNVTATRLVEDFIIILVTITTFGKAVGAHVREYKSLQDDLSYDVVLKDQKLDNVALVMVTAHRTILYDSEKVIVAQTTDILALKSRPKTRTKVDCSSAEAC